MHILMQYSSGGGSGGPNAGAAIVGIIMFVFILAIIAAAVCLWGMIFSKAGYSFWFALLMFVPLANLIWLLIFALSKWPVQQEVERLRMQVASLGGGYTGGFPVAPQAGGYPQQQHQQPYGQQQQQYGQQS